MSSARLAVPRAGFTFHSRQLLLQQRSPSAPLVQHLRAASTTARPPPPKPRVLEQPDKFRPPSHPARLRPKPRYTGPPLSEHERQAQTKRQYPHMMPPEGTFMHWFLTDRWVHAFISLVSSSLSLSIPLAHPNAVNHPGQGILVSLIFGIYLQEFLTKTPYRDLLPPNSLLLEHPFRWLNRWITVYGMHIQWASAQTAERRKAIADDVLKRAEYRTAHGLDEQTNAGIFGGWTAREDRGEDGRRLAPAEVLTAEGKAERERNEAEARAAREKNAPVPEGETYVAFDGSVQPVRKKFLGIF